MEVLELEAAGDATFAIRDSVAETGEFALVSPDVATCDDCFRDFTAAANRRFGYAFTNCTNCGPRYTIIRDIPYDRPNTTMAAFHMCAACQAEYDDPRDRRFHAQPNACPECGPALSADIEEARRRLAAGEILGHQRVWADSTWPAMPATPRPSRRLRERKRRSDKPFALMARDLAAVEAICEVSDADRRALLSPRRPIVILPRQAGDLPHAIAPGNRTIGVMLPYTPLHHLLFADAPYSLLVMTSGNLSEEPIVVSNAEARLRLAGVADWFLTHDRDIYMRTDDSVVRTFEGTERVMRRSRGFAPQTLDLGRRVPELLACGAELKNTFCLTKGRHAILSQHIGDLENYETLVFFEETLANLKKLFRVEPRAVAYDLHPNYLSTKYALGMGGLAEIRRAAPSRAHRRLHGREWPRGRGDRSGVRRHRIRRGWRHLGRRVSGGPLFRLRAARALALHPAGRRRRGGARALARGAGLPDRRAAFEGVPENRVRVVRRMIESGVNTVPTSSCGRLFDAVAAIIGLRTVVNFEAQAAIELEMIAEDGNTARYPFEIEAGPLWKLDFRPMIERIAREAEEGAPRPAISAKFHNTLAEAIVETCRRIRGETRLARVCLSGGTFQNMRLLALAVAGLRGAGFEVFLHAKVPPNDGGIALGQAAIAAELMR